LYIRRFSNQAFTPLRKMIDVFQKIEAGDLTQRLDISSLDEIGMLATYFNRMVDRLQALQDTLEERVRTRTAQLETVNAISQTGITILDPQKLTEEFVKQIADAFGYYLVALYLTTEDQKWVEIRAASGETGKVLVLRQQRYPIDGTSPIGKAVQLQQKQIIHYEAGNPAETFLPYTRSEVVFPLIVGKRILGALDIHSTRENAFDAETLGILQNIANQISVALANAETFHQMQEALEELESSQRLYMKTAWEDALTEHRELSYRLGAPPEERIEGTQLLNVPISLREQILGEILIEGHNLSDEDRAWVEAIATQAAVALENVRLLENSQRTALQERLVTEIIQRIWRARTIDGVLQTAVREVGQALQASEATIELYPANGEEA
jgi:GAF domain-containing protein